MKDFFSRSVQTTVLFLVVAGILALALSGSLGFISNNFNTLLVSAQAWISTRFVVIQEFLTVPRDVVALRQRNAELEAEVSRLQAQVVQLQNSVADADALAALVNFSFQPRKFLFRGFCDRARPQPIFTLYHHR
jgi:uncharacterized protein YlxW (UPF0749 family)